MIGAQALIRTLTGCGRGRCASANPGTSEMHFVAALDGVPEMARGAVPVRGGRRPGPRMATGPDGGPAGGGAAASGAGPGQRPGQPAQRPGRAQHARCWQWSAITPTWHKQFDSPLESDIDALAGAVSVWVPAAGPPAPRVAAGPRPARPPRRWHRPAGVATLILPTDVSWSEGAAPVPRAGRWPTPGAPCPDEVVGAAAAARCAAVSRACSCSAARGMRRARAGGGQPGRPGDRRPDAG